MKGVPLRMDIGGQEIKNKQFTLYLRDEKKKIKVSEKSIMQEIRNEGEKFDKRLREKADKWFEKSIVEAQTLEEISKALEKKNIVKTNFCSIGKDGEKCAATLEKNMSAAVRGSRADKQELAKGKCIICDRKANAVVYIARSY